MIDTAMQNEQRKRLVSYIDSLYYNRMWEDLNHGGSELTIQSFFQSDYFINLPFVSLECHLLAKIKTRHYNIQSGDVMDIRHASHLMPFSNFYITDKAHSNILKSDNLDKKYNTIITILEMIRK